MLKNRQKTNIISSNITSGDTTTNNTEATVNLFKIYFGPVNSLLNKNASNIQCIKTEAMFNICEFTYSEVFETLRTLSNSTKSDPDSIPKIIYRNYHYTLARSTHH